MTTSVPILQLFQLFIFFTTDCGLFLFVAFKQNLLHYYYHYSMFKKENKKVASYFKEDRIIFFHFPIGLVFIISNILLT